MVPLPGNVPNLHVGISISVISKLFAKHLMAGALVPENLMLFCLVLINLTSKLPLVPPIPLNSAKPSLRQSKRLRQTPVRSTAQDNPPSLCLNVLVAGCSLHVFNNGLLSRPEGCSVRLSALGLAPEQCPRAPVMHVRTEQAGGHLGLSCPFT